MMDLGKSKAAIVINEINLQLGFRQIAVDLADFVGDISSNLTKTIGNSCDIFGRHEHAMRNSIPITDGFLRQRNGTTKLNCNTVLISIHNPFQILHLK